MALHSCAGVRVGNSRCVLVPRRQAVQVFMTGESHGLAGVPSHSSQEVSNTEDKVVRL